MTRTSSRTCGASDQTTRGIIAALAVAVLCFACASTPSSGWTAFQSGLYNPVQLYSEETNVHGLRLSLPYTRNSDLHGIDLGVAAETESVTGVQANFLYNGAVEATGLQMTFFQNASTEAMGLQISGVNMVENSFTGFQLGGFVNSTAEIKGLQLAGLHNRSERVVGLQITSLVNETDELKGLQIGALNFNHNGLLPFFPIFNFGWGSESDDEESSESESAPK